MKLILIFSSLVVANLVDCFCALSRRNTAPRSSYRFPNTNTLSRWRIWSSDSAPEWFKAWEEKDAQWKSKTDSRLDNVESILEENKPLWQKASSSFEILVRTHVRENRGPFFSQQLTIRSLSVLAERCLPPYNFGKETKFSQQNVAANIPLIGKRIDRFACIAFENIPSLKDWMQSIQTSMVGRRELSSTQRKVEKLKQEFENFDSFSTDAEKLNYLRDNPLGFYAYSVSLLRDPDSKGYVEELELDMRGSVTIMGKQITHVVGEIKSGPNYREGIIQLVKRIGILYLAAKHSLPADLYSHYAIGELYGVIEWKDPDKTLVEAAKVEAGIAEYPDSLEIVCNIL
jgi:hypothetical protein